MTIALPVYNARPFLHDCLGSIFAQSWSDWELLIVDDGSNDGSPAILDTIDDSRVRILTRGPHRGLGASLNLITANARGEFLARMDADDMMHPSRLERQVRVLLEQPELDALGCGFLVLDRHLEPIGIKVNPVDHEAISADPLAGIRIAHATLMGRVELFRRYRHNEDSYGCEDWEFLFSTFRNSRLANLPDPLYFYRELDSFTVRKYLRRQLRACAFSWKHGLNEFGVIHICTECCVRACRALIYASAELIGSTEGLVRRRYAPLDEFLAQQTRDTIQQIRSTGLARR